MSNLNDFLAPVYKTQKTRTTKTLSGDVNDGGTGVDPQQGGQEYFSQTVNNIKNNSVVIRGSLKMWYSHQGWLVVRIWRNTIPSGSDGSNSDPMSRADLVYEGWKYFPTGHMGGNDGGGTPYKEEDMNFTAVDSNVGGTSATYKVCIGRTNTNSFEFKQTGTTIHFDTYDLFDLTD